MTDDPEYSAEEAIRDGIARVEPAADPEDDPDIKLTEHGEAMGRDVLRENEQAVELVVKLYVGKCMEQGGDDDDLVHALAEITAFLAEDAGINAYRILRDNPGLAPWLADDAISEEMVQTVEDDWINGDDNPVRSYREESA